MKRILLLAVSLLAVLAAGRAQCPDFTNLSGPGVTLSHGSWQSPSVYFGYDSSLYEVITQQGMDPYSGYQLPIIPSGETAVVKLGNDLGGKQSREINYTFTVDADYPILYVKYAAVMKHAGSFHAQGPFLRIILIDDGFNPAVGSGGLSINACGNYCFDATTYDGMISGMYSWIPWRSMGIDLSSHIGQQITIRFISYDCYWHSNEFSYVYFTASCREKKLTLLGCDGQNITLSAPDGYAGYEWNNGATTQTTTYSTTDGLDVSCTLHSYHGCTSVLKNTHIEGLSITQGDIYFDTVCQGEPYQAHGFNLPPQDEIGNHDFSRLVFENGDCSSGVETTLKLTVRQRYCHYYDEVCEGSDYDNYGFHYTNLQHGTVFDSIPIVLDNGCDSGYKYLHLTVNESVAISGELFGETNVCEKQVESYALLFSGTVNYYMWDVPEGVTNLSGGGGVVNLYFTEESPNPSEISVTTGNACGIHTFTKSVWHTPSYYYTYEDTTCTGGTYDNHGIHTARLDSVGLYFLSLHNTTVNGCDSDVMVRLVVNPTPTLTTLAQPEDLCAGESTIVLAVGDHGAIVPHNPQQVVPGDILCTDNTIVKPAEWPVPGKTAKAVVYFVDSTGQHGWAVHLQDQGSFPWGTAYLPASSGITGGHVLEPQYFLDGKINTQKLRLYVSATDFPAVWAVDFDNGWYLPAVGQLIFLFYELSAVNESLSLVNGSPFLPPFSSSSTSDAFILDSYMSNCYWSITPASFSMPNNPLPYNSAGPYFVDFFSLTLMSGVPGDARKVRSIIDF